MLFSQQPGNFAQHRATIDHDNVTMNINRPGAITRNQKTCGDSKRYSIFLSLYFKKLNFQRRKLSVIKSSLLWKGVVYPLKSTLYILILDNLHVNNTQNWTFVTLLSFLCCFLIRPIRDLLWCPLPVELRWPGMSCKWEQSLVNAH